MKKFAIFLISLVLILLIGSYAGQKWLESNLGNIINEDPARAYDITYDKLDLDIIGGGFDLELAVITPLQSEGTLITGEVEEVQVNGFRWSDLIVDKKLVLSEIIFLRPEFELFLAPPDSLNENAGKKVQQLFGDILSRGELHKFSLVEGSLVVKEKGDQNIELARIGSINLDANDIETDSLQWKYPIPFKLGEFSSNARDIHIILDDHSTFSCGSMEFEPANASLTFEDLSLKFNKDWKEVSKSLGKQIDLFEMDLKSLVVHRLGTQSQLYRDIDIRCESIVVDSLVLKDHRDKNFQRPPDVEVPLYSSMIGSIPIGLKVDTILIKNSFVSYIELPEGKTEAGSVHFDNLYGSIYNITTLESFKSTYKQFEIDLISKLNKTGQLKVRITVPYDESGFQLNAEMDSMDVTALNLTLQSMAGVEAKSGLVSRLELDMHATQTNSENRMLMNYTNLGLNILKVKEDELKKRGIFSSLANSVIRTQNVPVQKNYIIADYTSDRNIYRGPFNFMWKTAKEGFMQIVPSKTAKSLMGSGGKKKDKNKNKTEK